MCASRELRTRQDVHWHLPDGNSLFNTDKKKEHQTSTDVDDDVDENASSNSQPILSFVRVPLCFAHGEKL